MNLLKQLQEAGLFQPPSKVDIHKRKRERQAKFGKGPWKAVAYHKRIYLEVPDLDKRLEMEHKDKILKMFKEGKFSEIMYREWFQYPFKISGLNAMIANSDQCAGFVRAPDGEQFDMDVNWEVIGADVTDITIEGVISLDTLNLKDKTEIAFVIETLKGDGLSEVIALYGNIEVSKTDAIQKYYSKEGPALFKDWLQSSGGDSPGVKVTGPIEVKYDGDQPQIVGEDMKDILKRLQEAGVQERPRDWLDQGLEKMLWDMSLEELKELDISGRMRGVGLDELQKKMLDVIGPGRGNEILQNVIKRKALGESLSGK